jgi:hypothetical protein
MSASSSAARWLRSWGLTMETAPPDGFKPLFRSSPFLDHNGLFFTATPTAPRGRPAHPGQHANARGGAHGA